MREPSKSSLEKVLLQHNTFFDNFASLIPYNVYRDENVDASVEKFSQNPVKEGREADRRAHKATFAAETEGTETEQAKIFRERYRLKQRQLKQDGDDDDDEDDDDDDDDDDDEDDIEEEKEKKEEEEEEENPRKKIKQEEDDDKEVLKPNFDDLDDEKEKTDHLRAKLRAKMKEIRNNSNCAIPVVDKEGNVIASSKRAARKERKRQAWLAKHGGSAEDAESSRKKKKQKGKDIDRSTTTTATRQQSKAMSQRDVVLPGEESTANSQSADATSPNPATIKEDLAGIDFSRMTNLTPKKTQTRYDLENKSLAHASRKGKQPLNVQLEKAQARADKLEELKTSENQEDKDKAARMQWGDAMREASGNTTSQKGNQKLKTPKQIKREMKQKQKQREKSAKEWKARLESQGKSRTEKQKIRTHNLERRKVGGEIGANLSKKRIVNLVEEREAEEAAERKGRKGPYSMHGKEDSGKDDGGGGKEGR